MSNQQEQIIMEKLRRLSPERVAEVRDFVDFLYQREEQCQAEQKLEDKLEQRLYEKGLLSQIKNPSIDLVSYRSYKPIENRGKPLSELIIEERR